MESNSINEKEGKKKRKMKQKNYGQQIEICKVLHLN